MKHNTRDSGVTNSKVMQRAALCGALLFVGVHQVSLVAACETDTAKTVNQSATNATSSTRSEKNDAATSRFIDARALAVLRRADANYRGLQSFRCVVYSKTLPQTHRNRKGEAITVDSNHLRHVAWHTPHFARVTAKNTSTRTFKKETRSHAANYNYIANGDEMRITSSDYKPQDVVWVKNLKGVSTATQVALRQASDSLDDLLSGTLARKVDEPCLRALTYLGKGFAGNVAVERVQLNFVEADGAKISEVLAFDARGFLRSANIEYWDNETAFR